MTTGASTVNAQAQEPDVGAGAEAQSDEEFVGITHPESVAQASLRALALLRETVEQTVAHDGDADVGDFITKFAGARANPREDANDLGAMLEMGNVLRKLLTIEALSRTLKAADAVAKQADERDESPQAAEPA